MKDILSNYILSSDDILISLDVSLLFTNVSVDLVIKHIEDNISQVHNHTDIPNDTLVQTIRLITYNSDFVENGKSYHQKKGVSMDGSISVDLASICMNILLDDRVPSFNINNLNDDDYFFIISKDCLPHILGHFNNFHEDLQFRMEIENNKSIPLPDIRVYRDDL